MSRRQTRAGDAPLLAWGEALRARKARQRRLVRRVLLVGAGASVLLVSAALPPVPRLVWNVSSSSPRGLYVVLPNAAIEPGDRVVARLPKALRRLAAERHYLPLNVPLVKHVAAVAGDDVCAFGPVVLIDGRPVATRKAADPHARPLPLWQGCQRLHGRDLFLLGDDPASFDGRYFGVTDGRDVLGKAWLLWRR